MIRATLILISSIALAGCTSHGTDITTLRFWVLGNEGETVLKLLPEFHRIHPDIRVEVQQIPWTAAHEKLLTAFAGESMPDVSQLGNTWIPEFSVLGALEPLDAYVRNSPGFGRDDFFEGVLGTNVVDSTLYGIPWYVDTRVVYYRKDLIREAGYQELPRTWDGILRMCADMKALARSRNKVQYPFFLPTNEWAPAVLLGMQAGGDFLTARNTRGNFSGPKFRTALRLMETMYRLEYSPVGQSLITNLYQSIADGLIALYITGPWNVGEFRRRIPADLQDAWMTSPLPSMDSISPGQSLPLGTSLVLFKGSRHPSKAWKLIEFLTSREQSVAFFHVTGNLPPRRSAWEDSSLATDKHLRTFYTQLQRVEPLPQVPQWEQIVIRLQKTVEFVASGTMSVEAATEQLDEDVDIMLEKRRWLLEREEEQ